MIRTVLRVAALVLPMASAGIAVAATPAAAGCELQHPWVPGTLIVPAGHPEGPHPGAHAEPANGLPACAVV